ncbi:MAG TPA: glycosyltransferase [Verrucomicrobiae bacterium]|jgi:glycosyltransferase involved in cell wall biosynthesis|nr:glycosyltransferase [Verrucomicrobiae bacterium]
MNPSSGPLRILHLNSLLTGGGTDDQCVKLAGELHKLGQRVWLAGPAGRLFAPVIEQLGVPFFDTGAKAGKFQFIRRAADLIRRENIQILHGHHGRDLWPTIFAARLAGTKPKIVLTRHMAKSPGSWASRNFLLGQCDALIAVSEFVAKVLRDGAYEPESPEAERRVRPPIRGDHSKIHVISGGIDTAKFFPADASSKRRELGLEAGEYAFAVAGGFDLPRGKGQREFLAAAARIHKETPRARFLIIGRGSLADVLNRDIEQLGLRDKARLTGQVSDMPQVVNAIDCLVHPQIGTEALGLVICEAHACGKPVIASALDGIPEAFAPGGYGRLVAPENVEELAQAMRIQASQAKPDAGYAAQLHARIAETFSITIMAEKTKRLYAELFN